MTACPRSLAEELLNREQVNERKRYEGLLLSEVIDRLAERHFDKDADEPHRILASLPISTYVTTNFDNFLSAALRWKGKKPAVERCRWREDVSALPPGYESAAGTLQEPLVFHMYGNDEDPTSLVLTEDDHLDFLRAISAEPRYLPVHFKRRLTEAMLLFLGYDVRRLDCPRAPAGPRGPSEGPAPRTGRRAPDRSRRRRRRAAHRRAAGLHGGVLRGPPDQSLLGQRARLPARAAGPPGGDPCLTSPGGPIPTRVRTPSTLKDAALFTGRDEEAETLLSLAISERIVVFCAPSGAGKSSLLERPAHPRPAPPRLQGAAHGARGR